MRKFRGDTSAIRTAQFEFSRDSRCRSAPRRSIERRIRGDLVSMRSRSSSAPVSYRTFFLVECPLRASLRDQTAILESCLRNSNPKSEMPALKEKAASEKDKQARLESTEKERVEKKRGARNTKK